MFEISAERKGFYQWDLNQRLYITDSGCNEVHFCNEKHPAALTCQVQVESGKRYVQVPNILLQSCLPITGFFYVKGGEDAYTKRSFCIEVRERPKPDDYVYTETEVKTWESAVEYALQEAKESGAFKGERGEKGDKGEAGEQGPQGEKGDKGDGFLTDEDKLTLSIRCDAEGQLLNLKDASELPLAGLRIFGKTIQDGTPTPDAPVELVSMGGDGSADVTVTGANLIDDTNLSGSVLSNVHRPAFYIKKAGMYTISLSITGGTEKGINVGLRNSAEASAFKQITVLSDSPVTFEITEDDLQRLDAMSLYVFSGSVGATLDWIMLNYGDTAAEYEPFQYGGSVTISTPNGLPGIPVASGGNYTDESGQQWICDEIDFARGVHVQRIMRFVLDGSVEPAISNQSGNPRFNWSSNDFMIAPQKYSDVTMQMCNRFTPSTAPLGKNDVDCAIGTYVPGGVYIRYDAATSVEAMVEYLTSNPVEYMYVMKNPIENALTAAEIAAFKAIHTNKPNTTIYNDAGAWMQVSYAADTKTYIDNKFNELAAAIVNNT